MNTNKSLIQRINEVINARNEMKLALKKLLEQYNVVDCVFIPSGTNPGVVMEASTGYFVPSQTYDTIDEAMNNFSGDGIRVEDNSRFTVGRIYERLRDTPQAEHIIDLKQRKVIC